MLESDSRAVVSSGAGVVLILLLTLPSLFGVLSHFRSSKPQSSTYEDEDGVATEKSIADYSARVPKVLLVTFNTFGLLTSIAGAVLGTLDDHRVLFLENWLNTAQWVCCV
jgi:hypothetical protein